MTFTFPSFLRSLGSGEVEYIQVFVSSSFGDLQGHLSQRRQESKEYHPLNAAKYMQGTTSSKVSVPPHRLIGEIHRLVLELLFQNLWISSRTLLVVSNCSCLKNRGRLRCRKKMTLTERECTILVVLWIPVFFIKTVIRLGWLSLTLNLIYHLISFIR